MILPAHFVEYLSLWVQSWVQPRRVHLPRWPRGELGQLGSGRHLSRNSPCMRIEPSHDNANSPKSDAPLRPHRAWEPAQNCPNAQAVAFQTPIRSARYGLGGERLYEAP
jgi:hypothetical protein